MTMKAWQFRNMSNLNRRVDEPAGFPYQNPEHSDTGLGATEIGGFLLAAFVCTSAALLLATRIARFVFPPDSLLGSALVIASGLGGIVVSFLIPKPRVWGYVAFALTGAFYAMLLSAMISLPAVWVSHHAGFPLTDTPPHDDPILAMWSFLMFATTVVLCVRWRATLWQDSGDPFWIRLVGLVNRSFWFGSMIGTGILFGLAIVVGQSYLAWELFRNW